jgi:PAS domain S-box-containing protein
LATIHHIGLGNLFSVIKQKLNDNHTFKDTLDNESLALADLYIIGPVEKNPVGIVQKIASKDPYLSIIVMAYSSDFNELKRKIQFAPFVGKNTQCIALNENFDFEKAFNNARLRTTQRRSFRKINNLPNAVTSFSASAVKVEDVGTFLEQAPVGAILIDDKNTIVAINKKAKELFSLEENRTYILSDIFPAVIIQDMQIGFGAGTNRLSKIIHNNDLFLELHLSEVVNRQGKALNILLVNDVTERKRKEDALKESEEMFRLMAEAMPQKVWTADEKGRIQYFNQHWVTYTGYTIDELQTGLWQEAIHPNDIGNFLETWNKALSSGQAYEMEERIRDKKGSFRWHLVRAVPRKNADGKVLMWIGTNTDIHEQKEFAVELEHRVEERTFELEKSNSELEQFVYITSHDLQEPLRKIRMFSDMLTSDSLHIESSAKSRIEKISATAQRMTTLLKALLNFTQMSKQEQLEDTDLNVIISKALGDLELTINEKNATISVDNLPVLKAIPVQMHQLFYNLITNALKFSKTEITPVIQIISTTAEKQLIEQHPYLNKDKLYYEIVIQDNGIGFDPQFTDQIFNIFQRLHNRTAYAGTGIGLALCKKVVNNHHGAIYAFSEKGKGSSFHVLLPSEQEIN